MNCYDGLNALVEASESVLDGQTIRVDAGVYCGGFEIQAEFVVLLGAQYLKSSDRTTSFDQESVIIPCSGEWMPISSASGSDCDFGSSLFASSFCVLNNNLLTVTNRGIRVEGFTFTGKIASGVYTTPNTFLISSHNNSVGIGAARGIANFEGTTIFPENDTFEISISESKVSDLVVSNNKFEFFSETAIGLYYSSSTISGNAFSNLGWIPSKISPSKRGARSSNSGGTATSMGSSVSKVTKNTIQNSGSGISSSSTPCCNSLAFPSRKKQDDRWRMEFSENTMSGVVVGVDLTEIDGTDISIEKNMVDGFSGKGSGVKLGIIYSGSSLATSNNSITNFGKGYQLSRIDSNARATFSDDVLKGDGMTGVHIDECDQDFVQLTEDIHLSTDLSYRFSGLLMSNLATGMALLDQDMDHCESPGMSVHVEDTLVENAKVGMNVIGAVNWDPVSSIGFEGVKSPVVTHPNSLSESTNVANSSCPDGYCKNGANCSGLNYCSCPPGYEGVDCSKKAVSSKKTIIDNPMQKTRTREVSTTQDQRNTKEQFHISLQ